MGAFEFEITIQSQSEVGSWPVVVRCKQPDGLTIHARENLLLSEEDFIELTKHLESEKEYGLLLGKVLFKDSVRETLVRAIAKSSEEYRLRILLSIEAADNDKIRTLHWERLCAPIESDGGWQLLARDQRIPFSLYIPTLIDRRFATIGRRDLRALILIASPENIGKFQLAPFDVEEALEGVKTALGEIPYDVLANGVEGALGPPTLPELSKQLTSAKKPYTLLHFICHGMFQKDGETVLYWAQADNQVSIVTAENLIGELKNIGGSQKTLPHFAFLCTCQSADPRAEGALGGLAQRLVRNLGMPAVVAMTRKVTVETALKLGQNFYRCLRESGEVDTALQQATAGLGTRHDITVPALFSRLGGRPLFSDRLEGRELSDVEIEEGLEKLEQYLQERAPNAAVLERSYRTQVEILKRTRDSTVQIDREARHDALVELNNICGQVIEIDFNSLAALGKEPPPYDAECPFPGLSSFGEPRYHKYFFGRDALIRALRKQLEQDNFLAVLGPSGSGKSSVVLAGLVPRLEEEYLGMKAYIMKPGNHPLEKLAVFEKTSGKHSLLVVDQFEEVFTLCEEEADRQAFIQTLFDIAIDKKVIITIRADFLGECTFYPELRRRIETQQKLVGPMESNELISAMTMQANQAGLRFETGLSNAIFDDVEGEPGIMPLLQYALQELWQRRRGRWLCTEEYEAIGGVQQAIAKTADRFYESLPEEQKKQFRNIFLRLTRLDDSATSGETRRDTRQRVEFENLVPKGTSPAETKKLIQQLAGEGSRLVVTAVNKMTGKEEVEVAHEALIRHWPRLQEWLTQNRSDLQLQKEIAEAAREWQQNQDKSEKDREVYLIHREGRLDAAEQLLNRDTLSLNQTEENYIKACVESRERRLLKEKRTLKRKLLAATIGIVISTAAALLAGFEARKAEIRQIEAILESTDASTLANQTLNAKLKSVKAARTLKNSPFLKVFPQKQLEDRVISYLSNTAYRGQLINRFQVQNQVIQDLAFSPDGQRIAIAGSAENESAQNNFSQCPNLSSNAASNDSSTETSEATISIFNRSGQTERHLSTGLKVQKIAYSPDGLLLAAIGRRSQDEQGSGGSIDEKRSTIKIWNTVNSQTLPLGNLNKDIETLNVNSIAFNTRKDNSNLVIAGETNILLIKIEASLSLDSSPPRLTKIPLKGVNNLVRQQKKFKKVIISPNSKYIAAYAEGVVPNTMTVAKPNEQLGSATLEQNKPNSELTTVSLNQSQPKPELATENKPPVQEEICVWYWNGSLLGCYPTSANNAGKNTPFFVNDMPQNMAFSPNEQLLAVAGKAGKILVFNLTNLPSREKSNLPNVYELQKANVNAVAFSPNSKYLATGGQDNKVIRIETAELLNPYAGELAHLKNHIAHYGDVYRLGFLGSKDGARGQSNTMLFTAGYDKSIDLSDFEGKSRTPLQTNEIQCHMDISPDGKLLVAAGYNSEVRIWDTTGKQYLFNNREDISEAYKNIVNGYFDINTLSLVTVAEDGTGRLWKHNQKQLGDFEGLRLRLSSSNELYVTSSQDGRHIATILQDGTGRLWDSSGQKLSDFDRQQFLEPDNKRLENDINSEDEHPEKKLKISNLIIFSPDNQRIITIRKDGRVRLWNISGEPINDFGGQRNIVYATFSPDGQRIITIGREGMARLWDNAGQSLRDFQGQKNISYAKFSPDGQRIITVAKDSTLRLWDGSARPLPGFEEYKVRPSNSDSTSAPIPDSESNPNPASNLVTFSPNSQNLITIGEDGAPSLWNNSGKLQAVLTKHTGTVYARVSSNSQYILTYGTADTEALLWNSSGKLVQVFKGSADVFWANFSRDAKLVVITDKKKVNHLWNLEGKELDISQRLKDFKSSEEARDRQKGEVDLSQGLLALSSGKNVIIWDTSGQESSSFRADTEQLMPQFTADGKFLLTWGISREGKGLYYFRPYLWRIKGMNELIAMNCNWLKDYLENSTFIQKDDRKIVKFCRSVNKRQE